MVHADGAWGGYFCTTLRTPPTSLDPTDEGTSWFTPPLPLSTYVQVQLSAIPNVDTITIDPHKSGFCPYPAGATCYRDKRINNFLSITNQVVYYHGAVNLGDVGIEGSKPGAAAAGVVMAHRVRKQWKDTSEKRLHMLVVSLRAFVNLCKFRVYACLEQWFSQNVKT